MTLHVLVEGPSELALLERWAPRLQTEQPIRIHPHQGKGELAQNLSVSPDRKRRGLLDQLPAKLRGFNASLDQREDAVLVLIDADNQCPNQLRATLLDIASQLSPSARVGISVAVEETEAFYLGDLRALQQAFPDADMGKARRYVPDSICGTWEVFAEIVGDDGDRKVAWAEAIGVCLTTKPSQSRSPSFRRLIAEILQLNSLPSPAARNQKAQKQKAQKQKAKKAVRKKVPRTRRR